MNLVCPRCHSMVQDKAEYNRCARCGAMVSSQLPTQEEKPAPAKKGRVKKELPTEEEMVSCPRGT